MLCSLFLFKIQNLFCGDIRVETGELGRNMTSFRALKWTGGKRPNWQVLSNNIMTLRLFHQIAIITVKLFQTFVFVLKKEKVWKNLSEFYLWYKEQIIKLWQWFHTFNLKRPQNFGYRTLDLESGVLSNFLDCLIFSFLVALKPFCLAQCHTLTYLFASDFNSS